MFRRLWMGIFPFSCQSFITTECLLFPDFQYFFVQNCLPYKYFRKHPSWECQAIFLLGMNHLYGSCMEMFWYDITKHSLFSIMSLMFKMQMCVSFCSSLWQNAIRGEKKKAYPMIKRLSMLPSLIGNINVTLLQYLPGGHIRRLYT